MHVEKQINGLADVVGPMLEHLAPKAFHNMTMFNRGQDDNEVQF